ncbi:MAG: Crp/Fnr family transcriptional regulator [Xanthomonadales bacterium]|nr:Crp/Fnr family transcriptional regulator [Xanthomonadales bacterium]
MREGEFEAACARFREAIGVLASVPDREWSFLRARLKPAAFRRGEDLVTAGDDPRHFWFLDKGLLRFFYVSESGREFNKAFARPGEVFGALVATVTGEPCGFSIQAVSDAFTVAVPNALLEALYERHPCWERIGRRLAEQATVRKEVRERELLIDDPLERYRHFRERYSDIAGDIPQRQIAAYIGISEVQLSRLLNR